MRLPNPESRFWKQSNNGETPWDANVVGTFNADTTTRPGKISLASRLKQVWNTTDNANLSTVFSFLFYDEEYWGFSRRTYRTDTSKGYSPLYWRQDTSTDAPSPSDPLSDAVVFDNGIVVSLSTSLSRYVTSWTPSWQSISLTNNVAHPLETITIGSPVLCIGNNNVLATVTGSGTYTYTAARLTLDTSQRIKWIRAGTSQAYIGTHPRRTAGKGMVYIWDGGATQPTRSIELNSRGAISAVVHNDILYIVTAEGEIQRLDGSGFTTVAKFPVANSPYNPQDFDSQQLNNTFIHQRGSAVRKGKILFNIKGGAHREGGVYIPHNHSGIWEYDLMTGSLTHKHSFMTTKTGTSDFGQVFAPDDTRDYAGALMTGLDCDGTLLASNGYATTSATSVNTATAIYIDDFKNTIAGCARVVFPQAFTKAIAGFHNNIIVKYQPMKAATNEIVVKYRTTEKASVVADVTWASATQFTTTTDISTAVEGEEVFVLQANGAGDSAQIVSISETGGTYTVTLSRSIIGVSPSGTGKVVIQNWKELERFNDMLSSTRTITAPTDAGAWLQVMVELRGTGDSPIFEEIEIKENKAQ